MFSRNRKAALFVLFVAFCVSFFVVSCAPAPLPEGGAAEEPEEAVAEGGEEAICEDPTISAISAHGNLDDGTNKFDTMAEVFLYGGGPLVYYFAPSSWPDKRHIHHGITETAKFYREDLDTDANDGIDQAMLFFYAGHGQPDEWDTLGDVATQEGMALGNCSDDSFGKLRYYWQCSCQVFAHGPPSGVGGISGYDDPGSWDGSSGMQNIFERWGPALDPNLRMACGGSTDVECNETVSSSIWQYKQYHKFDVPNTIIKGLDSYDKGRIALCITLGGPDVSDTPLVTDAEFTELPNNAGDSYYHIQYSDPFTLPVRTIQIESDNVPDAMPILQLDPDNAFIPSDGEGDRSHDFTKELSEEEYVVIANGHIEERGLTPDLYDGPFGTHMRLASVPVDYNPKDLEQSIVQKNVSLTYKRQLGKDFYQLLDKAEIAPEDLGLDGGPIPVIGLGGVAEIELNNNGSLRTASKIWRNVVGVFDIVPVKSYEDALTEAQKQLEDSVENYELERWSWGYREEPANVVQQEMRIYYEFHFTPTGDNSSREFPPQVISIVGQEQ